IVTVGRERGTDERFEKAVRALPRGRTDSTDRTDHEAVCVPVLDSDISEMRLRPVGPQPAAPTSRYCSRAPAKAIVTEQGHFIICNCEGQGNRPPLGEEIVGEFGRREPLEVSALNLRDTEILSVDSEPGRHVVIAVLKPAHETALQPWLLAGREVGLQVDRLD